MLADSYKYTHTVQYPVGTVSMFDYAEARSIDGSTVFFGLQYILKEHFTEPIEQYEVDEAHEFSKAHGIEFNKTGWDYIVKELGGHLPVKIRAVQEGLLVPNGNVLFTVESTDQNVFWVVSWLETILMTVWYTSTVATRSYFVRKMLEEYAVKTQETPFVLYQFHNFGARGSTGAESAMVGGMAHLAVGFLGTGNFSAIKGIQNFYPVSDTTSIAHSISATEHSTTTSWGKEQEFEMIMKHIEMNKGKPMIAAVMDSYDYFKAVRTVCAQDGEFQRKINSPDYPVFVIRPDSGDPKKIIPQTLDIMEKECVPYTMNNKGFKVFNKMRIIWGDGINTYSMREMLDILVKRGYSSENISFGSGGWLMQHHNRDTLGFAIKCSEITVDEGSPIDNGDGGAEMEHFFVPMGVFKDPITDPGKKSKKGKVTLWFNHATKEYFTDKIDFSSSDFPITDMLNIVYENGKITKETTLEEIRNCN